MKNLHDVVKMMDLDFDHCKFFCFAFIFRFRFQNLLFFDLQNSYFLCQPETQRSNYEYFTKLS